MRRDDQWCSRVSVQALSWAFAIRGVSSSEKLVLLALANYANDKLLCWPSQERLAEDTELSDRTVWAALKGLEAKELLSRQPRKRADGTRSTDVFTLLIEAAEPVANSAKPTRNSCEDHSQILRNPVATVATLTTFEPSSNHQLEEPREAQAPAPKVDPRGSRLPDDWFPSVSDIEWADGFTPQTLRTEADKFRDYWRAVPGAKGRKLDWNATWRNWIRRAAETSSHGKPNVLPAPDHKRLAREANLARAFAGSEMAAGRRS